MKKKSKLEIFIKKMVIFLYFSFCYMDRKNILSVCYIYKKISNKNNNRRTFKNTSLINKVNLYIKDQEI